MANQIKNMNGTVVIPKEAYVRLKQEAHAYRTMVAKMFELPLRDTISNVVADFKATDLYTEEFLTDLKDGLCKSSYAQKYAHQTASKRR